MLIQYMHGFHKKIPRMIHIKSFASSSIWGGKDFSRVGYGVGTVLETLYYILSYF